MPEYCTTAELSARLTAAGAEYVADRDHDGEVSDDETATSLAVPIAYAGQLIDAALVRFVELSTARNSGNEWLRDRCLDIAAARAVSAGGRDVPDQMEDDRQFALTELDAVTNGKRVPGLIYPEPGLDRRSTRVPRAANPGGC